MTKFIDLFNTKTGIHVRTPFTVLPVKSDSDVMLCLSNQGFIIYISLVY